jgi:hypothetical protein
MLKIYLWIMGWSGKLNSWAWRKQAAIVREHNRKKVLESHYYWCLENGRDVSWYKKLKRKKK